MLKYLVFTIITILLVISCTDDNSQSTQEITSTETNDTTSVNIDTTSNDSQQTIKVTKTAKYVFLFIGDGMGFEHIQGAESFLQATGKPPLFFPTLSIAGEVTTRSNNMQVTGSAASATAMATGKKTDNEIIGKNPTLDSNYTNIPEIIQPLGYKVGIVTNVSLDQATPSAFYAHVDNRYESTQILNDAIESGINYFAAGSFDHDLYKDSSLAVGREVIQNGGYTLFEHETDFDALKTPLDTKVFFTNSKYNSWNAVPYTIDMDSSDIPLKTFTKKGIEFLSKNKKGFFMMVEGGETDWPSHNNDAATMVHEVIAFDEAIKVAYEFYQSNPDSTLILITADHETGKLAFDDLGTSLLLSKQNVSYMEYSDTVITMQENGYPVDSLFTSITKHFGFHTDSSGDPNLLLTADEIVEITDLYSTIGDDGEILYGTNSKVVLALTRLMGVRSGFVWGRVSHSSLNVPYYAVGPGAPESGIVIDNTDFFDIILGSLGVTVTN